MERFIGLLIEEYAGAFPIWLAPVQVRVLPIADRHHAFAGEVTERLRAAGYRPELDIRNEKIGFKIRGAEVEKIPYMIVVGDREAASGQLSVRRRGEGDLGGMSIEDFQARLADEVQSRAR